jgi:hypothetical protein
VPADDKSKCPARSCWIDTIGREVVLTSFLWAVLVKEMTLLSKQKITINLKRDNMVGNLLENRTEKPQERSPNLKNHDQNWQLELTGIYIEMFKVK